MVKNFKILFYLVITVAVSSAINSMNSQPSDFDWLIATSIIRHRPDDMEKEIQKLSNEKPRMVMSGVFLVERADAEVDVRTILFEGLKRLNTDTNKGFNTFTLALLNNKKALKATAVYRYEHKDALLAILAKVKNK